MGRTKAASRILIATVTTSTGLNLPGALAFDSGHSLWVADTGNNRVLEYATPFSTGEAASLVIGQSNFTSSTTTPQFNPTSTDLNQPKGLAFDPSGNLWVADWTNSRVLQYGGPTSVPEFPALVVPIVFTVALVASLLLQLPSRRYRRLLNSRMTHSWKT